MIRLGVIGLGTIFQTQIMVLKELQEQYKLVAVYDADPEKIKEWKSRLSEGNVHCHKSEAAFLKDEEIEAVLIATPPETHFSIAKACLQAGKHVLLEKPAVITMWQLQELYRIAVNHNCLLHVAYHAAHALDLGWYLAHQDELQKQYSLGKLKQITCRFFDPYMSDDGSIQAEKLSLCGSYLDSGVNELSVCAKLVDLSQVYLVEKQEKRVADDDERTIYESHSVYAGDGYKIFLETGWNRDLNHKETILSFENSEGIILLNHSEQSVSWMIQETQELLWSVSGENRLEAQYKGVLTEFAAVKKTQKTNQDETMKIHRVLLEG